ncbi:hypothetical protein AT3G27906 [Arabidopsis thaliana]|jgi:hypothetical protein|uniref:At3g27906 n=1 Tax=Arabidopsis thaliana TaxID=3702 RepID=Q56YY9_ARATH|nr:uncharacterized protein AT3G27906 [Arabidopsis thaliana]NP_001325898.1 uncharacterized protein AT3G27906 [Arabidopsis thaliana]NP_001325899.1 uncharacterized protein AT3G27906 [Arabidopsis thaliana]ABF59367.1 unknown protein [Arabidopsis thaliana]ABR46209.1 At3g27906 [Arabidopsis thaliana]AEE77378.1 hypothetical protein AT3G27906 [Arabidopsis thaliana]ANM63829.1 hypothetical protein AT3G27906 [Arabidopsis thaliana]ANM63830.1 hypothetical protein AT3G27906 [Arabidopsis thaliana]|eukprot:NP_001319659.1 hypothetical protein AT3G27906 [Arabidopsis thaliana]
MLSDAGGGSDCRRRDLSTPINLHVFYISFIFIESSSVISNLSKYLNLLFYVSFFTESFLCDGRVYRCSIGSDLTQILDASLSSNPKQENSQQSNSSSSQTSEQDFINLSKSSRSGLAPTPPLVSSHRFSLMAGVSLGPSDVLLPLGTSTAHDELKRWQWSPYMIHSRPSFQFFRMTEALSLSRQHQP